MNNAYIYIIFGFIFCFTASYALLAWINQNNRPLRIFNLTNLNALCFGLLSLALLVFGLVYDNFDDFVSLQNHWTLFCPLLGGIILIFAGLYIKKTSLYLLAQGIVITTIVLLCKPYTILFSSDFPLILNQLFTILLWLAALNSFNILLGIEALFSVEMIGICLSLIVFGIFFNALPLFITFAAFCFLGILVALTTFTWYPAKIRLPHRSYLILGYALSWLLIMGGAEYCGSCMYIFSLLLILETTFALIEKLINFRSKSKITSFTASYQANLSGLAPDSICRFAFRINFIFTVIGCFQYYSDNFYTIPLIATIIGMWYLYRLYYWNNSEKNAKISKNQILQDMKDGFEQIKQTLNKDN